MTTSDTLPLPDEWRPGLDALRGLPDGAAALLIGATDRGKTTFTTLTAQALAAEGGRVAVVDGDIGQSEIGPPGTVGVAWADARTPKLHDLEARATFFVGAFAAHVAALEHAAAVGQAVHWAQANGAKRILVDTTGFVSGPAARRLKVAKAQIIQPALILGLSKGDEIAPLVSALAAATGAKTLLLPVPAAVGRKSTSLRTTRRLSRLSQALTNARELTLPLDSFVTVGATLGVGEPVAPHLARWAGTALRLPVVYAEKSGEGTLTIFLRGPIPRTEWEAGAGPVAEHFGARTVRALSLAAYADVLIGLHDGTGKLLSVGRFLRLDVEKADLVVSAPLPASAVERIRLVAFGRVRVQENGSAGAEVRPGEI